MFGGNDCMFFLGRIVNCFCLECNEYVFFIGGMFTFFLGLFGLFFCRLFGIRFLVFLFLDGFNSFRISF